MRRKSPLTLLGPEKRIKMGENLKNVKIDSWKASQKSIIENSINKVVFTNIANCVFVRFQLECQFII